ncbi:MAG: hypothetical protein JRI36_02010 [Deltaproteobacteria bacterium]|nr:hypothetical protein [Deltaproteobacteria bacterium]
MPKGSTRDDALVELARLVGQVRDNTFVPAKCIPLFKTVAQEWLEYKKLKVRSTTWEVYRGHVDNHFALFNPLKMDCVTVSCRR